jgi:hypothetical protein
MRATGRPVAHAWWIRLLVAASLFSLLLLIRTRQIAESFWLLGDQILYWNIALGSWQDLPLGGGPSSVGGTTLGPVFTWLLWACRVTIGAWTDNLPHAGGIGICGLQSAADALLLLALWRERRPLALAAAAVLLVATAPYDMALTATIWNPPVAEAFVKAALALTLLGRDRWSPGWAAAATAMATLAVQAHSSAIFVAVPLVASFVARDLWMGGWRGGRRAALAAAAVILVVEVPFLINLAGNLFAATPASVAPATVVQNVVVTIAHPERLRLADAYGAVARAFDFVLLRGIAAEQAGRLLAVILGLALIGARRDLLCAAASVFPIAFAIGGMAFWQQGYDHYWFLTLMPAAGVAVALAASAVPMPGTWTGGLLLAAMLFDQPARIGEAMTIHRLPAYGPLVRASRELLQRSPEVSAIEVQFPLPPSTSRDVVYRILGGRMAAFAPRAVIGPTGTVTLEPAANAPAGAAGVSAIP